MSLILGVEEKFSPFTGPILPLIVDNMGNSDWMARKISVDAIYTLSVLMPESLENFKSELLEVLNHCRFDKIKHVRDAAVVAINIIKDFPTDGTINEEETVDNFDSSANDKPQMLQ